LRLTPLRGIVSPLGCPIESRFDLSQPALTFRRIVSASPLTLLQRKTKRNASLIEKTRFLKLFLGVVLLICKH
jgi:hypothetical protein